jgi:hypothetical protein
MKPVPVAVENALVLKSRSEPVPTVIVRTNPPVARVPDAALKVTVVLSARVIFPTLPVPPPVNVYVPLANEAALFAVNALVYGAASAVLFHLDENQRPVALVEV